MGSLTFSYPFPKLLASLEVRHILGWHRYLAACLRIAPRARRPVIESKAPEAANLHTVTLR